MGGNGMHTAPNPGPPIKKVHDCSFDRAKTLMRTIETEGMGLEAREGTTAVIHLTVTQPNSEGQLVEVYNSKDYVKEGLKFELGRSLHSEAVERMIMHCKPGSVIDALCTDPDLAYDPTLNIHAQRIPEGARKMWCSPQGPVGVAQDALKDPPVIQPQEDSLEPPWQPPRYAMLFHVLLDSVNGEGAVPMYMSAVERLDWVTSRKAWATELFQRKMYMRAMRHYKKALLDLETPCEWYQEEHIIERNQLRLQLHLNTALCGLKVPPERQFPNLQAPKIHFDPHHDAIFHCTRVLDVDKRNVKALYRRALAHMMIPPERHINGLHSALEDLKLAHEIDPQNADVTRELKRAKAEQKAVDQKATNMFTKMIGTGTEV